MSEAPKNTPQDANRSAMTDGAGNAIQTPAGSEAMNLTQEAGQPFATIGDQSFASQEEMSAWWDKTHGQDILTGDTQAAGSTTQDGAAGNDSIQGASSNDSVAGTTRSDDEIRASLKEAGGFFADPKYEPFALEFEKAGDLSPESITAAAKEFGVTEDMVTAFVGAQKAARTAATAGQASQADIAVASALVKVAPDEKTYNDILTWGKEHLSPTEQAAYNAALDRKDGDTAALLLEGFKAKWTAAGNGDGPRDVTSEGAAAGGGGGAPQGYASMDEQKKAQADPKYDTDANYRAEVMRRIGASTY